MSVLQIEFVGSLKVITLNRPEALNSLNFQMISGLRKELEDAKTDNRIETVLLKGAGGRAFCAGGDIKAAREGALAAKAGHISYNDVTEFFVQEYALNRDMFHFPKTLISFMNGITMGGGVGLANACRYKIATDKTIWAMPEVTIGFFPDVGAAYYLTRCPGYTGRYLGLTGVHLLNAGDLLHCGLASHFAPVEEEEKLIHAVSHNPEKALKAYQSCDISKALPYEEIGRCFSCDSLEGILKRLQEEKSEWADTTIQLINSKSPTSLKVTLRHLALAEKQEFDEIIARDLKLADQFLRGEDMAEGIRAAVVDKDRNPKWKPSTLESVSKAMLEDYFN